MTEPIWLDKSTIKMFHDVQIERFGGSLGMRDETLLDSAMGKPQNIFAYNQGDIFDMAASYTFGIAKNHPFIDGNKRAAFMSAYTFLGINGHRLDVAEAQVVVMTVALANDEITQEAYAQWLRDDC